MISKIRKQIANDLNVIKFTDETEQDYNQRIIYSAAAMWIRSLIYSNYTNDSNWSNVDILFVQSNLAKIISKYLEIFTVNIDWLESDTKKNTKNIEMDIANVIIQEMIDTHCISEVHDRKISPVARNTFMIGNNCLIHGLNIFDRDIKSVGVSQWKIAEKEKFAIPKKIIDVKGKDYYEVMESNFEWQETTIDSNFLIFLVGKTRGYSRAWGELEIDTLQNGIFLLKEEHAYTGGYLLLKKNQDKYFVCSLDPWYAETREIYRIMYALNLKNSTPARFRIKEFKEYVILFLPSALPEYENRILLSSSWPYSNYADKFTRIIPIDLWNEIKKMIIEIGGEIVK